MRARSLLIITALLSSFLGAVAVYLVLTVPNDVQASVLLKQARSDIAAGNNERARQALAKVVQQYPRTDAAAAATVALSTLEAQERQKLTQRIDALQRAAAAQSKDLQAVREQQEKAAATPPPAPVTVVAAPPPAKKTPPVKKTPQRAKRRSRRR